MLLISLPLQSTIIITHARSVRELKFGLGFSSFYFLYYYYSNYYYYYYCYYYLCHDFACKFMHTYGSFFCTKMAAMLGMCLLFKTVVSSYWSNNTHFKYSKWKEKAFKNTQKPV